MRMPLHQTAQAIYVRLELAELADGINGKIAAARAGIEAVQAEEEARKLAQEQEMQRQKLRSMDQGQPCNKR